MIETLEDWIAWSSRATTGRAVRSSGAPFHCVMGEARLEKPASDNSESHFLVERNCGVLRFEPQDFEVGIGASDIGYDRVHQSGAEIPAAPCREDGHSLDFCNAGLIDAPTSRGDRGGTINTRDVAANFLMFINFEMDIDVLLDFKHQGANDDAATVVMPAFSHSENGHGSWPVAVACVVMRGWVRAG
jgi:hypothetical protein